MAEPPTEPPRQRTPLPDKEVERRFGSPELKQMLGHSMRSMAVLYIAIILFIVGLFRGWDIKVQGGICLVGGVSIITLALSVIYYGRAHNHMEQRARDAGYEPVNDPDD